MDKDLKNKIVIFLLGVAIATPVSLLFQDYLKNKNQDQEFLHQLQKEFYDKGAAEIKSLMSAKSAVISKFHQKPGLTAYELENEYRTLQDALGSFWSYIEELKRYGNSEQIELAYKLEEWTRFSYAEIHSHYLQAENVQATARKLLLTEDNESEWFQILEAALMDEIQALVRNENRMYYTLNNYRQPVEDALEQYFYYLFRKELGLESTVNMANSINSIPQLVKEYKAFKFKKKKFPFVFGTARIFQSPDLVHKGDVRRVEENNEQIHHQLKLKFLAQVIEHSPELKRILEKRNESDDLDYSTANN